MSSRSRRDDWARAGAPDAAPLLNAVAAHGGVVGGICAGTLALARAGLFAKAAHTSNDRDRIATLVPDYQGKEHYRDVPRAVVDGGIIPAPGSAPGTFATEFLRALYPDEAGRATEMKAMFARQYTASRQWTLSCDTRYAAAAVPNVPHWLAMSSDALAYALPMAMKSAVALRNIRNTGIL